MLTAGAVARAIGGRTLGGTGGIGGVNPCTAPWPDGAHGVAVDSSGGGTWSQSAGPNRAFTAPRIVREGQPLQLVFSGAPSERAFLAVSSAAARVDSAALDGVLLLQGPFRRVGYGMLDPQGALTVAQTTPDLPVGATNDLIHMQPVMVDAMGGAHLGCAGIVVRLDASY